MQEWVTDQVALEMIFRLRMLEPGDEVLFHGNNMLELTVSIPPLWYRYFDSHGLEYIRGWRRREQHS